MFVRDVNDRQSDILIANSIAPDGTHFVASHPMSHKRTPGLYGLKVGFMVFVNSYKLPGTFTTYMYNLFYGVFSFFGRLYSLAMVFSVLFIELFLVLLVTNDLNLGLYYRHA